MTLKAEAKKGKREKEDFGQKFREQTKKLNSVKNIVENIDSRVPINPTCPITNADKPSKNLKLTEINLCDYTQVMTRMKDI